MHRFFLFICGRKPFSWQFKITILCVESKLARMLHFIYNTISSHRIKEVWILWIRWTVCCTWILLNDIWILSSLSLKYTATVMCLPSTVTLKIFVSTPFNFCHSLLFIFSFIKGLPVRHVAVSEELKRAVGLEPMPKGINYIISTKVHKYSINTNIQWWAKLIKTLALLTHIPLAKKLFFANVKPLNSFFF